MGVSGGSRNLADLVLLKYVQNLFILEVSLNSKFSCYIDQVTRKIAFWKQEITSRNIKKATARKKAKKSLWIGTQWRFTIFCFDAFLKSLKFSLVKALIFKFLWKLGLPFTIK